MVGTGPARRIYAEASSYHAISSAAGSSGRPAAKLEGRISKTGLLFDLIVVLMLAAFPCIYDIDGNSYGEGDQTTHAKVTQEMLHDGHWLIPTNKGKPYINKPPFKMWLVAAPVKLLGESTFSYRILDGIIGVLTVAAIYLFAALLFNSRLCGYLAALAQLGCTGWFFGHGVRESVQDGAMIFFTVLALICGYRFVETAVRRPAEFRPDDDTRRLIRLAALGGLFVGLGLMTKSAAALIAPIIIGTWLLVSGRMLSVVKNSWRELVLAATVTVSIPAMYFVPYFTFRPRAMWMVFNTEVFKRATQGYHNTRHPRFYLDVLFEERAAIPPELLVAVLLAGLYFAVRRRDHRFSFLICWSIVPILVYSAAKSKLAWYINPAYPGMAILSGAVISIAIFRCWSGWQLWGAASNPKRSGTVTAGIFAAVSLLLLGWNAQSVSARVLQAKKRNPVDLIVSKIQANRRAGWPAGRVIAYDYGKLNNNERLYWEMAGVEYITDPQDFIRAIDDPNLAFVITKAKKFHEIAPLRPFDSYAFLPPKFVRRRWGAVIGYRNEPITAPLKPAAWGANFADYDFAEGFGLENTTVSGSRAIRRSTGPRSSLLVAGDIATATFGYNVRITAAPLTPVIIDVFANTFKIAELELDGSEFKKFDFHWPRERIETGKNLLTFQYRLPSGAEPLPDAHVVAFESIEFKLAQPQQPKSLDTAAARSGVDRVKRAAESATDLEDAGDPADSEQAETEQERQ